MLSNKLLMTVGGEEKLFSEDVFSAFTYQGNGSTQTINNGIDLAGKGGMVWTKSRTEVGRSHALFDTSRGINSFISSNLTSVFTTSGGDAIASFNSTGHTLGPDTGNWGVNNAANGSIVSWTFRKAPKFFDIVTYTGNGVAGRTIPHSLGIAPGMVIVKRTDAGGDNWVVYHRSTNASNPLFLNLTNAASPSSGFWNNTEPTVTDFTIGSVNNSSGATYVAYLFAHDTSAD